MWLVTTWRAVMSTPAPLCQGGINQHLVKSQRSHSHPTAQTNLSPAIPKGLLVEPKLLLLVVKPETKPSSGSTNQRCSSSPSGAISGKKKKNS